MSRVSRSSGLSACGVGRDAQVAQNRVDDALRRWQNSVVPVEDCERVGDRRARTSATIAAAMRQGLLERERVRQRKRWGYVAAAAGVLLALGSLGYASAGGFSASAGPSATSPDAPLASAKLTGRAGAVFAGPVSADELLRQRPVGVGTSREIEVGDRVITRERGEAGLEVGGDTRVRLHQLSELVLAKNGVRERRVTLNQGNIDVAVEPAEQGHAYTGRRNVVVETPNASIVVHGTRFTVDVQREPAGPVTRVSVTHGTVAVFSGGAQVARLGAGQSWSSHQDRAAVEKPAPPAEQSEMARLARPNSASAARKKSPASTPALRPPQTVAAAVEEVVLASSTLQQENRLFRRAVDARNRGDDAKAVQFFEQLLAKYPASALAQEAKVERFRALKRLGRDRDAARQARRYLIDHGNGFATDEARDVALTPGK